MPSSQASSTPSVVDISDTDSDNDAAAALSRPVADRVASSLHTQDAVDALCKNHGVPTAYTARPAGDRRASTPPPELVTSGVTSVDLRTYLSDAKKLVAAFASPPSLPSHGIKGMDSSAAKAKPERDGDTPSLSRTKRKHEEATSAKDGLCRSEQSMPHAAHAHGCSASARGLGAPPGFDPKPPHSPEPDTHDSDSADWQAAKKALERMTTPWRERAFAAAKPSDVVASSYSAMLQAANYASFSLAYTLELKEKLAARDAEVAALREQLESAKGDLTTAEAEVESARTTAVQQFLTSEEHKRRLAEHALAGYERGAEEMKRAVLRIYPHLDAARLVVPLD